MVFDLKAVMLAQLEQRRDSILGWTERLRRQVEDGTLGGEPGRQWLAQYAVGKGLNIACGDFPIGESFGVDLDYKKIAVDYWGFGDALAAPDSSLDFIVTNYLECFPNTRQVLREWYRALREDGVLAIVACNADSYTNPLGPFANHRRFNCFSPNILKWHLEIVGFKVFNCETEQNELRVAAKK